MNGREHVGKMRWLFWFGLILLSFSLLVGSGFRRAAKWGGFGAVSQPPASPETRADERPAALQLGIRVQPDGATDVKVHQGKATLRNPLGEVELQPGEEGYVEPGRAPERKPPPAPESPAAPVR